VGLAACMCVCVCGWWWWGVKYVWVGGVRKCGFGSMYMCVCVAVVSVSVCVYVCVCVCVSFGVCICGHTRSEGPYTLPGHGGPFHVTAHMPHVLNLMQDIYKKLHEVEALTRSMDMVGQAALKNKGDRDALGAALNMLDAVHPQVCVCMYVCVCVCVLIMIVWA